MVENRMNVFIGMQQDEEFVKSVSDAFEQVGIPINRIELRGGKKQILQYLDAKEDVDIIIVSCGQAMGSFDAKELDLMSQRVSEKNFVVIVSDDMYGGEFLAQLAACGIYTCVFEKDATIEYVVTLIKNGRSRVDARTYYGIQKNGSLLSVPVERFDTAQSIAYLNSYSGTVESLYEKMKILEKRLQPSEVIQLISELPEDLFSMVHRIPEYATICSMVVEQRGFTQKSGVTEGTGKRVLPGNLPAQKKGHGVSASKLSPKEMLGLEEEKKVFEIGFTGFNTGVGCTYNAIMMAHAIADTFKDKKVAIVEFDSDDASFYSLCRLATSNQNISGLNTFKVKEVTYFFNTPYSQFTYTHRKNFDYVIYDFGCCNNDTIKDIILPLDRAFAVVDTNEWRYGELSEFHGEIFRLDVDKKLVYLMPNMDRETLADAVSIVKGHKAFPVSYEKNPYNPSASTKKLLVSLLDQKKLPARVKVGKGFKGRLAVKKSSLNPAVLGIGLLVLIGTVLCYTIYSNGEAKYEALRKQASTLFNEKEAVITSLQEELGNMSASMAEKERIVVFLKQNVSAGEIITEDMVEERVIYMDVPQEQYFQMSYVGYYKMAVDMYAGEPIHASNVVRCEAEEMNSAPEGGGQ